MINPFFLRKQNIVCAILSLTVSHAAFAQEAYVGQIGTNNAVANVDLSSGSFMAVAQIGDRNNATQIAAGGTSTLVTAQLGNQNLSASLVNGNQNFVGTVQLGFGHTSLSGINGASNQIVTFQSGAMNRSQVDVTANNSTTTVTQNGFGLQTTLNVQDSYTGAPGGSDPLSVGINQSAGDPAVNALVQRDASGSVTIRPGTATTVLRLPG